MADCSRVESVLAARVCMLFLGEVDVVVSVEEPDTRVSLTDKYCLGKENLCGFVFPCFTVCKGFMNIKV